MSKDVELKKEVGYEIKEVYKEKGKIVVEVERPEPNLKTEIFRFGPDLAEKKEFVEDGEIKEMPKWKLRLKSIISDRLEQEQKQEEVSEQELKAHEGKLGV